MKLLTKMTIYTDKGICLGNIWHLFVIHVNMLETISCQCDFGKDSLANIYLTLSLLCVNANSLSNCLCQICIAKETLPM